MVTRSWIAAALGIGALAQPVSSLEAAVQLPIAQGVWVKTATSCASATNVYVHKGNRFGSVYFYGPNHSMGPADETELVVSTSRGKDGYTTINEGPIEVGARLKGQASVRAYSLSQGPQWTETVRLCPAATLSSKLRGALMRLKLI
ncbi:MAG: hypothetical protein EON58_12740 [Alphaproteobacteria bacterium]|nr:MAG: hypothetical protein EON58_12740 [Alphaproteobacteria bacterium]